MLLGRRSEPLRWPQKPPVPLRAKALPSPNSRHLQPPKPEVQDKGSLPRHPVLSERRIRSHLLQQDEVEQTQPIGSTSQKAWAQKQKSLGT